MYERYNISYIWLDIATRIVIYWRIFLPLGPGSPGSFVFFGDFVFFGALVFLGDLVFLGAFVFLGALVLDLGPPLRGTDPFRCLLVSEGLASDDIDDSTASTEMAEVAQKANRSTRR